MKKTVSLIIMFALALTLLFSCGKAEESIAVYEFDIDALAGSIASSVSFDDSLVRLSGESAEMRYVFGYDRIAAYAGSGATAEVVIVCEFADNEAAEKGMSNIRAYLDAQHTMFEDYNVSELPKLENAMLQRYGRYTVCVVAPDTSAAYDAVGNAAGI